MKKIFNRKYITAVMIIVLLLAGAINRNYSQSNKEETTKILGEAAYVNNDVAIEENSEYNIAMNARDKARDEAKETLQDIINNPNTTGEGRKSAEQELISLVKISKNEADCEMILKEKGFENVVVTITDAGANVSVSIENPMNTEIAQITETVSSVTGIAAEKIKILSGDWYS